jgi:hypothetical protein
VATLVRTSVASARARIAGAEAVDRRATFLVAVSSLVATTAAMCLATVALTRGTLTYIIDDAYIHLTMARNLAFHGTWGMVPGEFQSSSSSPGWVTLIAGLVRLAPGLAEWLPLIVNALACVAILAIFARYQDVIAIRGRSAWRIGAVLLLPSVLFLPGLIQLGMEHSVHTAVVLVLLLQLERMLQGPLSWRRIAGYAALLLFATGLRFETACLALGCGLVLFAPVAVRALRERTLRALLDRRSVAFAASALAPLAVITAVGLIDLAHGQYFLPNSIVEKTHLLGSVGLGALVPDLTWAWAQLSSDPFMLAIIAFAVVAILQRVRLRAVWIAWLIGTLLHAAYAQFGWYERYQAYLLISGVLLALRSAGEIRFLQVRSRQALALASLLLLLPVVKFYNIANGPASAFNQFAEQNQMAVFLSRYYQGHTVMVNDIGHVTWLHQGGLVDMWALGSFEVLEAQRNGYYNAAFMTRVAREHKVAAVAEYSPSFDFLVPNGFIRVATWRIIHSGDARWQAIVFWAPDQHSAAVMREHMRDFIPALRPQQHVAAQIDG